MITKGRAYAIALLSVQKTDKSLDRDHPKCLKSFRVSTNLPMIFGDFIALLMRASVITLMSLMFLGCGGLFRVANVECLQKNMQFIESCIAPNPKLYKFYEDMFFNIFIGLQVFTTVTLLFCLRAGFGQRRGEPRFLLLSNVNWIAAGCVSSVWAKVLRGSVSESHTSFLIRAQSSNVGVFTSFVMLVLEVTNEVSPAKET
jgi:hypothetical protein